MPDCPQVLKTFIEVASSQAPPHTHGKHRAPYLQSITGRLYAAHGFEVAEGVC